LTDHPFGNLQPTLEAATIAMKVEKLRAKIFAHELRLAQPIFDARINPHAIGKAHHTMILNQGLCCTAHVTATFA
jgi:hypothetical protein